jgi:PTH1 family peptidyl-tRNA hydrolase
MAVIQLIIGLGNPGPEYANSRHNLGFMALRRLADCAQAEFSNHKRLSCLLAKTGSAGARLLLALPQTYMNLSGRSASALTRYFELDPSQLLVVYDDLDLEFGRMKINLNRGAGGHRGVQSIIDHLGSAAFARLRLGIGRPRFQEAVDEYVLRGFYPEQKPLLPELLEQAKERLLCLWREGPLAAMQRYNGKDDNK